MSRFLGVLLILALACGYPNGPCPDAAERYVPQVGPEFGYPDPSGPYDSGDGTPWNWVCPGGEPFDGSRHWMLSCATYFCDEAYTETDRAGAHWYCVDRDHLDSWMDTSCKGCWLNDGAQDPHYAVMLVCDTTK